MAEIRTFLRHSNLWWPACDIYTATTGQNAMLQESSIMTWHRAN